MLAEGLPQALSPREIKVAGRRLVSHLLLASISLSVKREKELDDNETGRSHGSWVVFHILQICKAGLRKRWAKVLLCSCGDFIAGTVNSELERALIMTHMTWEPRGSLGVGGQGRAARSWETHWAYLVTENKETTCRSEVFLGSGFLFT